MHHLLRPTAARLLSVFFLFAASLSGVSASAAMAQQTMTPPQGAVESDPVAASPLSPLPNASPRQTFSSFTRLTDDVEKSLLAAIERAAENDAIFDTEEVSALKKQALADLIKATSTLDLSSVAPASRRSVGISSVLLLKEILDRLPEPDLAAIPGRAEVAAGKADHGWVLPGTEIRMVRVEGADGSPDYLFSEDTVQRLPTFYALVRDMPERSGGTMDFYQDFVLGPGLSMPVEFYRYVLELPDWMRSSFHEQAVWQWMAFAFMTVLLALAVFVLLRWEGRRVQPVNPVVRSLERMIAPLLIAGLLELYLWLNDDFVNLTGDFLAALQLVVLALQAVAVAVVIVLGFNAVAAMIVSMPRVRKESLDASLIRLILRVLGILVASYVIALAVARMGVPLYGIIASLGVGGLALALAVRPTLENFIGGIILYADRPVKVGDFCKFGSMVGTVEEIGLRSTKVRGLDRTLVTVQNSEFSQMSITNYTRRDANLINTELRLRYETTREQLSDIIDKVAEMLRTDERIDPDTVRVCLKELGDYSLDLEVRGMVRSADWGNFLKIREELLLRVMGIVYDSGSDFAFPSYTSYLGTDNFAAAADAAGEPA
ncbi:MscS family membrane protein [Parvibaculum sp. MBR-TMA-1.3b-4.2]|jgi:MscS family membrane protein